MFTFDRKPRLSAGPSPALKPVSRRPVQSLLMKPLGYRLPTSSNAGADGSASVTDTEGRQFDFARIPITPPAVLQRKCTECEDEEKKAIQTRRALSASNKTVLDVGAAVRATRHSGAPLPQAARDFFEPRFEHDFSGVRVHTDEEATLAAQAVHARAYTIGQHIVFGRDQYAPATAQGMRLLAHELTHVVQQTGAAREGKRAVQRQADSAGESQDDALDAFVAELAMLAGVNASAQKVGSGAEELSAGGAEPVAGTPEVETGTSGDGPWLARRALTALKGFKAQASAEKKARLIGWITAARADGSLPAPVPVLHRMPVGVSSAGDPWEQNADAVADWVLSRSKGGSDRPCLQIRPLTSGAPVQRQGQEKTAEDALLVLIFFLFMAAYRALTDKPPTKKTPDMSKAWSEKDKTVPEPKPGPSSEPGPPRPPPPAPMDPAPCCCCADNVEIISVTNVGWNDDSNRFGHEFKTKFTLGYHGGIGPVHDCKLMWMENTSLAEGDQRSGVWTEQFEVRPTDFKEWRTKLENRPGPCSSQEPVEVIDTDLPSLGKSKNQPSKVRMLRFRIVVYSASGNGCPKCKHAVRYVTARQYLKMSNGVPNTLESEFVTPNQADKDFSP